MKQQKIVKLVFTMLIAGSIGLVFGYGIAQGISANNKLVNAIETKLQKNCNCEIVNSDVSAIGIQFSIEDGFRNSEASYILANCKFSTSLKNEATRLNNILKEDVKNYESLDLISFQFKSSDDIQTVKFKEGKLIQNSDL